MWTNICFITTLLMPTLLNADINGNTIIWNNQENFTTVNESPTIMTNQSLDVIEGSGVSILKPANDVITSPPKDPCLHCVYGNCSLEAGKNYYCLCEEGFEGKNCDIDKNECHDNNICNGNGKCVNIDKTLLGNTGLRGYYCECFDDSTGDDCSIAVDNCSIFTRRDDQYCMHGTCLNNTCTCNDGWGGERCNRIVPVMTKLLLTGCLSEPSEYLLVQKNYKDGECNLRFNNERCFFDGFDCQMRNFNDNFNLTAKSTCSKNSECLREFANEKCSEECNTVECAFDGYDCQVKKATSLKDNGGVILLFAEAKPLQVKFNIREICYNIARKLYNGNVRALEEIENGLLYYEWDISSDPKEMNLGNHVPSKEQLALKSKSNGTALYISVPLCVESDGYSAQDKRNCFKSINLLVEYLNEVYDGREESIVASDIRVIKFAKRHEPGFFDSWGKPLLFSLFGICLPLFCLSIFIGYLCYKQGKLNDGPDLPTFWTDEVEYSEAFTVPDSPVKEEHENFEPLYVNMHYNNNEAQRSIYPSIVNNNCVDAVRRGDLEEVRQLLFMNVCFKGQRDNNGSTVLHIAINNNHLEMQKLLLDGVASGLVDVFERNNFGQSPIVFAASLGITTLDCFVLLTETISQVREYQRFFDPQQYRADDRKWLPLFGENFNEWALVDDLGRNVIHYAALNNLPRLIMFLAANGADVNYIDFRGDAPLHLAARDGSSTAIQALLDCKADRSLRDADGLHPLTIAENRSFSEIIAILRSEVSIPYYEAKRNTNRIDNTLNSSRNSSSSQLSRSQTPFRSTAADTSFGSSLYQFSNFNRKRRHRTRAEDIYLSQSELSIYKKESPPHRATYGDDLSQRSMTLPRLDICDNENTDDLPSVTTYETDTYVPSLSTRYKKYCSLKSDTSPHGTSSLNQAQNISPCPMLTFKPVQKEIPLGFT